MEEDKIQIVKDIEQAELSFKALSSYAPNLEMYGQVKEKITMPLMETISLNSEVSLSSAVLVFTNKFLSIPLEICTNIHLFSKEPIKVIEYVQRALKRYEIKLGNLYLDLIIKIVNDPKRFQKQSPQLEYYGEPQKSGRWLKCKNLSKFGTSWRSETNVNLQLPSK